MKLTPDQHQIVAEYGHLYTSTGGNDIVELMQRDGVNYFNNPVVAEMQGCCWAQTHIIQALHNIGALQELQS